LFFAFADRLFKARGLSPRFLPSIARAASLAAETGIPGFADKAAVSGCWGNGGKPCADATDATMLRARNMPKTRAKRWILICNFLPSDFLRDGIFLDI
jgi:hypothetical protein